MPSALGELAALATAVCWTASSAFFTISSRRVGSVTVNRMRLLFAAALLSLLHLAIEGSFLPLRAEAERWVWLSLSGVVGLTLGDAFLFQAYVWIGARLTMLMMSTVPVITTFLAWALLNESLTPQQWLGVGLTLAGITWVVLDRHHGNTATPQDYRRGILFGLGAAAGQAIGLILAKKGLGGEFPALSGNLIRMVAAVTSMWAFTLMRGQAAPTLLRIRQQPGALAPILGGSISGPVVGVWFSLIAIQLTRVGVASTIMALPPVFLLPVARLVFGERFGWQAVVGTLVAMAGVAMLFLA